MKDRSERLELSDEQLAAITGGDGMPVINVNPQVQTNVNTQTNVGAATSVNNILFSNVQGSNVGQNTLDQINAARQGNRIS